jgi:hypothetical protein
VIAASDITAGHGAQSFESVLQSLLFPKLVVHHHRSPAVFQVLRKTYKRAAIKTRTRLINDDQPHSSTRTHGAKSMVIMAIETACSKTDTGCPTEAFRPELCHLL